jgi:dTDP-glucose 4,6-dehydratase
VIDMRILVTGGMGFIGSNFVKHAIAKHDIVNIDKLSVGSNVENLRDLESNPRYRFVKDDIRAERLMTDLLADVDAVVHFAAETHVDRSIKDPSTFIESNVIGTFRMLEAERKLGSKIRHVQVSTDEVYGSCAGAPFTEGDRLSPSNPYSATKASGDLLCCAYHRTYGMDVLVTRCTNNFGPNQFPEKLIPKTIIRALHDLAIPIYGTGEAVRDWLYVCDHCNAIEHILNRGSSGEVYNVSTGNEVSTLNLVKQILGILGKPESLISHVRDRPGHDMRYSLDSSKLRKSLGWRPEYDFSNSLRRTVEWYVGNKLWWGPLTTPEILSPTPWV